MRYLIIIIIINIIAANQNEFNSSKAYNYVIKQCEFGARYPGSEGHKKCKVFLFNKLLKFCDKAIIDEHTIMDPLTSDSLKIYNIFGRINPERKNRILLMAHWDTRRFADKDINSENHDKPVLGANDGASGVSVLLTLIETIYNKNFNNIGIDILFTDAEDMGRYGESDTWAIGSKLFSQNYPEPLPQFAICVDMVGDKDLEIKMEQYSYQMAPQLMNYIWNLANQKGYDHFKWELGPAIVDDHLSFSTITKIPSIDLIDLDYLYWHTINDTPDNVSQYNLGIVGNVLLEFLYNMDQNE